MKKGLLMGCVMVAAMALLSSVASADIYMTTKVVRATAKPSGVTALMLVKPAGTSCCSTPNCWYTVPSGSEDQALAVALSAISLGSNVRVGLADANACVITEIGLDNSN